MLVELQSSGRIELVGFGHQCVIRPPHKAVPRAAQKADGRIQRPQKQPGTAGAKAGGQHGPARPSGMQPGSGNAGQSSGGGAKSGPARQAQGRSQDRQTRPAQTGGRSSRNSGGEKRGRK